MIGYSGHEYGLEPSVVAVALGAEIIERHVALEHKMRGTDHGLIPEVYAMDLLNKRISDIHGMLGSTEEILPCLKKMS